MRQWCPMQRDPTTISPPAAAISLSQASKPSHNLAFRLQLSSQWEGFTPSLPTGFLQQVFEIGRYVYFGSIKKGNYVQVVVSFSGQSSTQAIVACIQEGGSGGGQMVIFKRSAVGNSQHGQVVISAERPVVTLLSITWPLLLRMMMMKMMMMIMVVLSRTWSELLMLMMWTSQDRARAFISRDLQVFAALSECESRPSI